MIPGWPYSSSPPSNPAGPRGPRSSTSSGSARPTTPPRSPPPNSARSSTGCNTQSSGESGTLPILIVDRRRLRHHPSRPRARRPAGRDARADPLRPGPARPPHPAGHPHDRAPAAPWTKLHSGRPRHLVGADRTPPPPPTPAATAQAVATALDGIYPRLTHRGAWADHSGELPIIPGTLIRLQVERLPGDHAPKPVWLWSSITGANAADVDRWWQSFLRRFDLEHTFRLFKQTLGWTAPKICTPAAADRWTWLIIAAHTQLRLARPLSVDLRRPWGKPVEPTRLTPARVRRGFRNLRANSSTPASAPNPPAPAPDAHPAPATDTTPPRRGQTRHQRSYKRHRPRLKIKLSRSGCCWVW